MLKKKKVFNVEVGLISKLVQTGDILTIKNAQIKNSFFTGENRQLFKFIDAYVLKHKVFPSERVLRQNFPLYNFEKFYEDGSEFIGTPEPLTYWVDEVRRKVKHNTLVDMADSMGKELQDFNTDAAYDIAKKAVMFMENEVVESTSVDITKGIDSRKELYKFRKENKGIIGLPTGIDRLDYRLKGFQKQQLITLIAQTGIGKAVTLDTPVLTNAGFVPMRDIRVGSKVCSRDGEFYNVSAVYPQGSKQVYRVHFEDGTYVDCCKDHLWTFKTIDDVRRKKDWQVKSIYDIKSNYLIKRGKSFNISIPVNEEIKFSNNSSLLVDPYVLGALLGDGGFTTDRVSFTNEDDSIVNKLNNILHKWGKFISSTDKNYQYTFKGLSHKENKLFRAINSLGLKGLYSHEKFIPYVYLISSVESRYALLQGLIDSDGSVNSKGSVSFFTCSPRLRDDVMFLVRSLGYRCTFSIYKREGKRTEYVVRIAAKTDKIFTCDSRKDKWSKRKISNRKNYYKHLKIVDIQVLDEYKDMQCITVDSPDHTFICGDFIVTHNTWFEVLVGAYAQLNNYRVLQFVTEMPVELMRDRYEAVLFGMTQGSFNYSKFKSGKLDAKEEEMYFNFLDNSLARFEPLYVEQATGVSNVAAKIDFYSPDLVLIDAAYLMEDDKGAKEDWLRIANITRGLKMVCKSRDTTICINTQADSNTSQKVGPELGNIKYSKAVGEDSDVVLGLFQDQDMRDDREMMLKVLKQREGTLGKIMMNWNFSTMDFSTIYDDDTGEQVDEDTEAQGVLQIDEE